MKIKRKKLDIDKKKKELELDAKYQVNNYPKLEIFET